jgi:hypothetical protein
MWQAWTNGMLGLWLAMAPFVSMDVDSNKINNVCVGLIVATVSWYIQKEKSWQRWTTMILGVWIFIASFIPALVEGTGYLWNNLVCGIIIALVAITVGSKSSAVKHA